MRITPLDVRKQEFRRIMRGLDADEVYAFLSTVADEYETVLNDNKALRERLLELDDKVQEYRSIERTLRDTLLTAERVTVESKDNARREASLIVKEAQLSAEKALRDITSEAARLRQEVQRLHSQRDAYLAKMKVIVESHLKFIESAEHDFLTEDRAAPPLEARTPVRSRPERMAPTPPPPPQPQPRPVNLFEAPAAAPIPSPEPDDENDGTVSGLGEILDRLSQSQRDTMETTQKLDRAPRSAPAPAPATPPPAPPRPEAARSDEASAEWNMEQFRRDLQNITAGRPLDTEGR
jgi:cell division initiation protein